MGLFDKLFKPKTIKSRTYGEVLVFVSEEKLPDDLVELNKMGRYYLKPYDGQKPEPDKAFLANRKLVQLDTEKKFMEARRRLGDQYADGQGTARDVAKGNALRNEWYSYEILHCDDIYSLGMQLTGCLERNCMDLQQMTELAHQRLKLDWENYASPAGAAVLELLKLLWKDRDLQAAKNWNIQQYSKYLYDTYKDANALYLLADFEDSYKQKEAVMYRASEAGSVFATAYITGLTLAYSREEAEMKRLLEYRNLQDQQMLALQEKAGTYIHQELEEILK